MFSKSANRIFYMFLAAALTGCAMHLPGASNAAKANAGAGYASQATIDRDEFGVPYIEAQTETAGMFALAYAMAEDGFYSLEDTYTTALGRASAYYGASVESGDVARAALDVTGAAHAEYNAASATERHNMDAFADGLNYYMQRHPGTPARQISQYEGWMVVAAANDAALIEPGLRAARARIEAIDRTNPSLRTSIETPMFVAVGATRASGHVLMLVASSALQPYEFELHTADDWRFHGITTLGVPYAREGFTAITAFAEGDVGVDASLTALHVDATDSAVYSRSTTGASASTQLHATYRTDTISVNTSTGVVRHPIRSIVTDAGVVIAATRDTAFAMRRDATPGGVLSRRRAMMHAHDGASFVEAAGHAFVGDQHLFADTTGFVTAQPNDVGTTPQRELSISGGTREAAATAIFGADHTWTFQEIIHAAFDRHVRDADTEIPMLIDEWEQVGATNPDRALIVDSAVSMLRSWNRISAIESSAMTLYNAYRDQLDAAPRDGAYRRFTALESALAGARTPWALWGDANRMRRPLPLAESWTAPSNPTSAIPVAGAPARLGIMFAYDARSTRQPYVWAVDLTAGMGASVLAYGEGQMHSSTHWFDEAPLFAAGSLKQASAHAEGTGHPYHPGDAGH